MSDRRTSENNTAAAEQRAGGNPFVPQVKDTAILVGWIAGLILIAGLCWVLTQPVRNRFLLKAVNQVLEQSGDSRRLGAELSPGTLKPGFLGMGVWYTMNNPAEKKALIFLFIGEGTFFPCAAVVASDGRVEEFIPLNSHGEKMIKRISPEVLKLYTRRIEGSES